MHLHEVNLLQSNFLNETTLTKLWSTASLLNESEIRKSQTLLENITKGMTSQQRHIVEGIYIELFPLIEATLTQDQINQIFQQVEQGATQTGSNRTLLGKGIDVAGKANEIINNVGKYLQNTQPVQNADQKFITLQQNLSQKYPELAQQVRNLGAWMKSNPGKSAFVIGTLTALASLGAGPAGGAIAGQVLRGAAELVKGEKLSTAVGKGAKTAALGALAGTAAEQLGKIFGQGAQVIRDTMFPGAQRLNLTLKGTGLPFTNITAVGKPEDIQRIAKMWDDIVTNRDNLPTNFSLGALQSAVEELKDPDYIAQLAQNAEARKTLTNIATTASNAFNTIGAVTQGAIAGSGQGPAMSSVASKMGASQQSSPTTPKPQDPYMVGQRMAASKQTPMTESQIYLAIGKIVKKQNLQEGIIDSLKGQASNAASKVGNFISTKAKNITNKVTVDKLLQAWNKAGKPTDSEELSKVLQNAGVNPTVISSVYTNMGINQPQVTAGPEFDKNFGVPLNAAAAQTWQQMDPNERQQRIQKAQQAGYKMDDQTGAFTPPSSGYGQTPVGYAGMTTNVQPGTTPTQNKSKSGKVRDPKTGRYTRSGDAETPNQSSSGLSIPQLNLGPMADSPVTDITQDAQRRESESRMARAINVNLDSITNKELLQSILTKVQSRLQ